MIEYYSKSPVKIQEQKSHPHSKPPVGRGTWDLYASNGRCFPYCAKNPRQEPWVFILRNSFVLACLGKQWRSPRAGAHRNLCAPSGSFAPFCAKNPRQKPWVFILRNICVLAHLAVLKRRFLFAGSGGDRRNTLCMARSPPVSVEKKIPSKPCKFLWATALTPLCSWWRSPAGTWR